MVETRRGRGYVYALEYHIVWCVKYRHRVLTDEVDARLKEILLQVASDYNFTISEMETDQDHIHVLVECTPQHSIPNMVKVLKGISARLLFKEFPQLKKKLWGGHLWNPSYFVATVSEHTEEQIRKYIQDQKVK
ncbi:IS200/IS605 family transposase [Paenibacillus terreus]|uniref:IS200/IS605 family transposase n=1 Tax=Paenibacillus terreus TaxID=1387834 RepID=A0ABV5BEG7_9BACL